MLCVLLLGTCPHYGLEWPDFLRMAVYFIFPAMLKQRGDLPEGNEKIYNSRHNRAQRIDAVFNYDTKVHLQENIEENLSSYGVLIQLCR